MKGERDITYKLKNTQIDLLALMPCPVKVPFEKLVRDYIEEDTTGKRKTLNVVIEGHANHHLTFYEELERIEAIDQLPKIMITPGINALFYTPFKEKFVDKGYFEAIVPDIRESAIEETGYLDPENRYSMFTMNLLVMVVYKPFLNGLKIPDSLGELKESCYSKNVIIRGQGNYFCESVLLNYEKLFGMDGLIRLAKNTKYTCHPAQMIKLIKSKSKDGAAVYIMPYFYAKGLESNDNIEIIWPKEGAIVNAISMLVKKDADDEVKALAKFVLGKKVSDMCAGAFFPSVRRSEYNNYMGKLLWMGWDHINNNFLAEKVRRLNDKFYKELLAYRSIHRST